MYRPSPRFHRRSPPLRRSQDRDDHIRDRRVRDAHGSDGPVNHGPARCDHPNDRCGPACGCNCPNGREWSDHLDRQALPRCGRGTAVDVRSVHTRTADRCLRRSGGVVGRNHERNRGSRDEKSRGSESGRQASWLNDDRDGTLAIPPIRQLWITRTGVDKQPFTRTISMVGQHAVDCPSGLCLPWTDFARHRARS